MTTTTLSAPSSLPSLRVQTLVALAVLASFGAYSMWVVARYGYTGFLAVAAREPWAMQMLLDLVVACSFAIGWMRRDARTHGIRVWPYVVMTVFFGSIGPLAYIAHRGLRANRATA